MYDFVYIIWIYYVIEGDKTMCIKLYTNLNFCWKTIAFRNTIFNILKYMTVLHNFLHLFY